MKRLGLEYSFPRFLLLKGFLDKPYRFEIIDDDGVIEEGEAIARLGRTRKEIHVFEPFLTISRHDTKFMVCSYDFPIESKLDDEARFVECIAVFFYIFMRLF